MSDEIISIACPHCEAVLKTRNPAMIGKRVNCPKCGEAFVAKGRRPAARSAPVETDDDEEETPRRPVRKKAAQRRPPPVEDPADDDEGEFFKGLNSAVRMSQRAEAIEQEEDERPRTKKKARRKASSESSGPGFLWVVTGMIAAVVGAGIWAGIGYATESEIGYVAWGLGGLTGFVVAATAQDETGMHTGIGAAAMSGFAIFLGKFLLVKLFVAKLLGIDALGIADTLSVLVKALHPLDALWLFLACGTAFRVGSGGSSD